MSRLLEVTFYGSLVGLLVLAVDALTKRYMATSLRRLWWLLAALGFLVPFRLPLLPAFAPGFRAPALLSEVVALPQPMHSATSVLHASISVSTILLWLWLMGVVVHLAWALILSARTQAFWSKPRLCTDSEFLDLLEDCKAEANVTMPIGVVLSESIPSPAILGWLRPRLLLPASLVGTLPRKQMRLILLHELAHLRHRDIPTNWLFVAVRSLHWFNPVAVLISAVFKRFAEESADEAAIAWGGEDAPILYGNALMATIRHGQARIPAGGFLFLGESFSNLKQRITMITHLPSRKPRRTSGFLFAILLLAALLVRPAYAAQDPDTAKKDSEAAMLNWLTEIDNGAYARSWTDASSLFQKAVPADAWTQQIAAVRVPLGKCSSRVVASARYSNQIPGKPGLETVLVQYRTSFDNLAYAVETVTFVKEGETWKAAGYFIKPAT